MRELGRNIALDLRSSCSSDLGETEWFLSCGARRE
jgi:hypothetical protein